MTLTKLLSDNVYYVKLREEDSVSGYKRCLQGFSGVCVMLFSFFFYSPAEVIHRINAPILHTTRPTLSGQDPRLSPDIS